MPRLRTKHYTDIRLTKTDIKRIRKGYAVVKCIKSGGKDHWFSIKASTDRKSQRKIARLQAEIRDLKKDKRK